MPEVKTYLLDCPEGFTWEEGSHTHFALEGFNAGEIPNRDLIRHMFIDNRKDYYEEVKNLAADKDGLFYVVGSDEFLVQTIEVLREQGLKPEQIKLDKHEQDLPKFLSLDLSM